MESPLPYPDSPVEQDDAAYPCKGCGEILEEGKAFELAGNRWHIDCFRCNTCGTLLDSDANLLLLGDGSLICNNCTYSCSSCGNKIEDLAILTGDQAFCAECFKCRNCKKKIENLRYARTSQGIFCMDCHEALMARRRKRTTRNATQRQKLPVNHSAHLDKSLPSLPPGMSMKPASSPETEPVTSDTYFDAPTEASPRARNADAFIGGGTDSQERPRPLPHKALQESFPLHGSAFENDSHSTISKQSEISGGELLVPVAFDPTAPAAESPSTSSLRPTKTSSNSKSQDCFGGTSATSPSQRSQISQAVSPHIAHQDKGRQPSGDIFDPSTRGGQDGDGVSVSTDRLSQRSPSKDQHQPLDHPKTAQIFREGQALSERFKLQDVPLSRRSGGSTRSSTSSAISPRVETPTEKGDGGDPQGVGNKGIVHVSCAEHGLEESSAITPVANAAPPSKMDNQSLEKGSAELPGSIPQASSNQLPFLPQRGDSLESSRHNQTIPRKEVSGSSTKHKRLSSDVPQFTATMNNAAADLARMNGGKIISNPIESTMSKSFLGSSNLMSAELSAGTDVNSTQSFVAPRAPPLPPTDPARSRHDSISTPRPETPRAHGYHTSPLLPRYLGSGEFSMDDDMARILAGQDSPNHESFLRRVSHSVRHGRSFSDNRGRFSKEPRWPRSPIAGNSLTGQDISSPTATSSEHRDDLSWLKNELRRERQKTVEREQKIGELEAALKASATIKQVNTELREKRSTMVVLDTQREIAVRELEVLTEHIAAAKKTGDALDIGKLSSSVLQDFATALQRLKDSYTPQIEESIQKRNALVGEISHLTHMKDKNFQEFEQLSMKNAQLAELNNQLVHQIQELYKANSGPPNENTRVTPNGLGIYTHHQEKSEVSIEAKDIAKGNNISAQGSSTTLQPDEAEPAAIIQGPQLVNIRKGQQPKKFNWKKGGQNVAKGVTKGLKGAFSSTGAYAREAQFAESAPYGAIPLSQEYAALPKTGNQEPVRQGFGFFTNQKTSQRGNLPYKGLVNGSTPSLSLDASTNLFGSDLEQRCEFEKVPVPAIVTRCIEEVELRGMDAEGIYRKSGGTSQIQTIKDGFEQSPSTFDLSDPDLDIHAVTSALKQYFRRLPTPLITYDVYDLLLDITTESSAEKRIEALRGALLALPRTHREVLEVLMSHLKRVVGHEEENLMTSLNVAVVFAPTIMRPESVERELVDTARKNEVVQFMVERCQEVFWGLGRGEREGGSGGKV